MVDLSDGLVDLTQQYITDFRSKIPGARKHAFLFVAASGKPMPLNTLSEVFRTLRLGCSEAGPVTTHVLRHMWNEDFSDLADAASMSPEEERRIRCELMGWSPRSRMPDWCQKRRTREKAGEVSKALQRRLKRSPAGWNRIVIGSGSARCDS